jgi:hypothetical protein
MFVRRKWVLISFKQFMNHFPKGLNVALAVMLLGMGSGCEAIKQNSLTCDLWRKDPCASVSDAARGKDYLYGGFARAALTPLAIVGDATVIGVAIGAGCMVEAFASACQEGAQNGGRVVY